MSEKYLNIPDKILVGFKRENNMLSYVTYYKPDNTIAKENSWNSWRNTNIPYKEFDNTPVTGIKISGGGGGGYSWSRRHAYCQIIDPRGFELQISYPNLLFILEKHLYDPDNGFTGEFVYGWDGMNIILTPTDSDDYTYSKKVDEEKTYQPKECTIGHMYVNPKSPKFTYIFLGFLPALSYTKDKKLNWYDRTPDKFTPVIKNKYVFVRKYSDNDYSSYYYEVMPASIKSKLIYKGKSDLNIDDEIKKYYSTFSTSDNISTKAVTDILRYNIPGAIDITQNINEMLSNDNIKINDDLYHMFIRNDKYYDMLTYPENEHVFYLSKDKKRLYCLHVKYSLILNDPTDYYHNRRLSDISKKYDIDYLKTHTICKLNIKFNRIYHIEDNKVYTVWIDNPEYAGNYNPLLDGGTFLKITTDKQYYYISSLLYIDINDNRTIKCSAF